VPPDRLDFNGIFYWLSQINQWQQAGGPVTWDSTFETAIGGYPQGSVVMLDDFSAVYVALLDPTTTDPNDVATHGVSWALWAGEPTTGLARLAAVSGTADAIILTSAIAPVGVGVNVLFFVVASNNTTAVTLTVDGASPVALSRDDGSPLSADDLVAGTTYQALYNGTDWRLLNEVPSQAPPPVYAANEAVDQAPANTSSGTAKMQGIGALITPSSTGRVLVIISGVMGNATANAGGITNLRTGTGTPPANGDAVTGTLLAGTMREGVYPGASEVTPFSSQRVLDGLTVGTPYWFDADLATTGAGTAYLTATTISLVELP
jgi:hypothetical protein